jgi:hypothetical protein
VRRVGVLAGAVAAVVALAGCGDESSVDGNERPDRERAASLHLSPPQPGAGRCQAPTAENLRRVDQAFDAVVTARDADRITLTPTRWYTGDGSAEVVVSAPAPGLAPLVRVVDMREGDRYLVAATDGRVVVCGFTQPWTAPGADLYSEAFDG